KSPRGSLRWNGNVLRVSAVIADYDDEKLTVDDAVEVLEKAGLVGLVYTSPSHLQDGHGPRWRIVCPFTAELPPDQHYRMMSRLNGLFRGALAPESFTLSQGFYFGRVNGNAEHQAILVDGIQHLDQADELDETALGKPNGGAEGQPGADPEASIE